MSVTESLFSLNEYNKPKVLYEKDAIYTLIIRLLILEPGTVESHPDMGVGIVSKYRYAEDTECMDLKNNIYEQIQKYLPDFVGADIKVTADKVTSLFNIEIEIDGTIFGISYNSDTSTLTSMKG